jgi:hypothetical protein
MSALPDVGARCPDQTARLSHGTRSLTVRIRPAAQPRAAFAAVSYQSLREIQEDDGQSWSRFKKAVQV